MAVLEGEYNVEMQHNGQNVCKTVLEKNLKREGKGKASNMADSKNWKKQTSKRS